jgi:hypothetical protein
MAHGAQCYTRSFNWLVCVFCIYNLHHFPIVLATFTGMCYNVLCDKYATTNLYSYCPSWALNWEYRKTAIMKELRQYDTDIITLQVCVWGVRGEFL